MKPEITHMAYSTALTFELVTRYDLFTLGAPTFPSLRKDAIYKAEPNSKGIVIFMQYKLAEHIVGTGSSLKNLWGIPYYRFLIHPRKKVKHHVLLANLENMNTLVYYAAPEFHTLGGLYESLMNKTVLANTTFWSPSGIGALTENERNILSYKKNLSYGVLEPGNVKIEKFARGEMLLTAIKEKFTSNQFEIYDQNKISLLGDRMLENYLTLFHTSKERRLVDDIMKSRDHIDARDYLSLISTLLYDCYVYFVTG